MSRGGIRSTALALVGLVTFCGVARAQDDEPPAEAAPPPVAEEGEAELEEEAEAEEEFEVELDPKIFDNALEDYYNEKYATAAAGFWAYMAFSEDTAENYEWAQYFLAECMRGLGLWHAAVQYYYIVAKTRSRPEILPDALRHLEQISRRRPFSETMVFDDLIYDSEFGSLPKDIEHWVNYVQGLYDYRNGFVDWAEDHFADIPKDSYYGAMATYVEAVYALRLKKDTRARKLFESILELKAIDAAPEIANKVQLALARLLFDVGESEKALGHYDSVLQIELTFQQAQLLLEKAWAHFYLEDYRKAMGLLHALEAPSYKRHFLPDAYVLRGLIFKDLCHFIPAKRVVRAFRFAYGRTLDGLRRRKPMELNRRLFEGATQEGAIAKRTALLRSLNTERKLIEDFDSTWEDVGLDQHLRRLYDLEMREQARLWGMQFDRAADATALDLLNTEEQINLLDYEIGLDIFKRLTAASAREAREETVVVPYDSRNVYYEFDTEYWNDELHSYEYFISNRCFEEVTD